MSRTEVGLGNFAFRHFLGSVGGHIWRLERAIALRVVLPGPSASNAFKAHAAPATRLEAGREPDREARARLDGAGQRLVGRRLLGARGERGVLVLDLLGAELLDRRSQLGLVVAQRRGLVRI